MKIEFCFAEIVCWENEGGDSGAGAGGDAQGDTKGKTFTQDDVNKIVTNRVKQLQTQLQTTEVNYNKLLEQQNLSDEQRSSIEADLENVRAQMRTKEQQLEHDRKKEKEKYDTELKKKDSEASRYKSLYENSTIERAIVDAAAQNDGYDADQFVGLLKGRTKIVEELDGEGRGTGRLIPKVQWEVQNPETKKVEVVLKDPTEVVALMKETPKYGNLFKSNVAKGLGGKAGDAASRGRVDVKNMTPAEYHEYRKTPEGKRALGLSR